MNTALRRHFGHLTLSGRTILNPKPSEGYSDLWVFREFQIIRTAFQNFEYNHCVSDMKLGKIPSHSVLFVMGLQDRHPERDRGVGSEMNQFEGIGVDSSNNFESEGGKKRKINVNNFFLEINL